MKILMLLSNPYLPDARVYREAMSLISHGNDVTVLAWDREQRHAKRENMEGVSVIRVGPKARGKKHFVSDIRSFWKNALKASDGLDFDVLHAHDFDTLPLGAKIKKRRGVPLIFDAHEIYSEMIRIDVPGFVAQGIQAMENHYLKKVDGMVVVNDYQKKMYSGRVDEERIAVVMNAKPVLKDEEKVLKIRNELGLEGSISLIYLGALETPRFVKELADFAGRVPGTKVLIGGYGSQREYVEKLSEMKEDLIYLGFVHPNDVIPYSAAADMIVAMYREVQTDRIATKFFDAVAAGRGLIASDNGELTAELIKRYDGGLTCPYSLKDFEKCVRRLKPEDVSRMGRNMEKLRKDYSWDAMEERLLGLYSKVTSSL